MYCKQRKSSAGFPDRKAGNRLYTFHCIAGNALCHALSCFAVKPTKAKLVLLC